MCRFILYTGAPLRIADLVTEPEHSLIRQSHHSRLRSEPLNGDGFGVAWYVPDVSPDPARYRSVRPAWNDANLIDFARTTVSPVILAHIRAASPGLVVSEQNCHPFKSRELAFMHNGSIAEFLKYRRAIQRELSDEGYGAVLGSTDSEHAFALLLDHHAASQQEDRGERLAEAVTATIRSILELTAGTEKNSHLNFAVTDGECAVATRFSTGPNAPSLFMHRGRRYECRDGVCTFLPAEDRNLCVLIASEPLGDDEGWEEIPASSLVLVDAERRVSVRPLSFD